MHLRSAHDENIGKPNWGRKARPGNVQIYEDAVRMANPARKVNLEREKQIRFGRKSKKIGHRCPCGSGMKYKRRHGR
ncbi:SEC-C domain-containing protein [Enterobacter cloacae complex sp. P40RS]|uniref:SEC-C domain-containing protein n=1 Tax=Enterobacter pasteurii TaxID=3029761 RepID=A0ABR9Q9W6_9ENTR|nr:SEC-C domain-containing protein [Enterobacter pasteurii]MBE4865215.1 SEC-C domain-containing protein [Enterobacter cloacae complex sp. P40C2]MBE4876502.1 SEC-C domain-containing protein [Enterobacter cloacae complex sp. P40C]